MVVQYCVQIKTTFKFRFFYARKTGAGKFWRKYFAKNFCPDIYIFKLSLADLIH